MWRLIDEINCIELVCITKIITMHGQQNIESCQSLVAPSPLCDLMLVEIKCINVHTENKSHSSTTEHVQQKEHHTPTRHYKLASLDISNLYSNIPTDDTKTILANTLKRSGCCDGHLYT
jgi:hypothetical protein